MTTDQAGNLYVADAQTHRVHVVTLDGIIRTVAGTGVRGFSGDGGPAVEAQLAAPYGVAADAKGNIYIADLGNRRIRRVGRDGVISTFAEGFLTPRDLAVDRAGNLYVSDFDAHRVYRITPTGDRIVIAGNGEAGPATETIAALASLNHPAGLAFDPAGVLHIGDTSNRMIRKVENGVLRKVAEERFPVSLAFSSTGELRVTQPGDHSVAFGPADEFYVTEGRLIRRILPASNVVIAGRGDAAGGDGGPAVDARLNNPAGVALGPDGSLYISDRDNHRVRRVDLNGTMRTVAGTGIPTVSGDGGLAAGSALNHPETLSFDGAGNLYVVDGVRVRRVDSAGFIWTLSGDQKMPAPVTTDAQGNRYFIDGALRIAREDSNGVVTFLELSQPILLPTAIVARADGVLYVADAEQDRVWELSPTVIPPPPATLVDVVNSASLATGPLAPGSLATVRGEALSGLSVMFGETPARVLSDADTALIVEVPQGLPMGGSDVVLRRVETEVARVAVNIVEAAPALFGLVRLDGTLNSADNPVTRGEVVMLFGTGQGVTNKPVRVTFGGYEAELLFSGMVPGYPGLWQMNLRVPGGFLAPGERPVTVDVGGAVAPSIPSFIQ